MKPRGTGRKRGRRHAEARWAVCAWAAGVDGALTPWAPAGLASPNPDRPQDFPVALIGVAQARSAPHPFVPGRSGDPLNDRFGLCPHFSQPHRWVSARAHLPTAAEQVLAELQSPWEVPGGPHASSRGQSSPNYCNRYMMPRGRVTCRSPAKHPFGEPGDLRPTWSPESSVHPRSPHPGRKA